MADDLSKGFDLFRDSTLNAIKGLTDPQVKRGLLELYAEEVVKQTKGIIRSNTASRRKILESGIVYKISADNNQVLIGWSKSAMHGPLLEDGYHHIKSRKFIKIPHLKPGALKAKFNLRVMAREYLMEKVKDYDPRK